jgi:autotransporter-associated beta strand protein
MPAKISHLDFSPNNGLGQRCIFLSAAGFRTWLIGDKKFSLPVLLGVMTAAMLLISASAQAAPSLNWLPNSGDWFSSGNWGGTVPTSSYEAYIANDGTAIVNQSGAICSTLYVGKSGVGKSGAIQMTGGDIQTANDIYVGYSGIGTFNQSAGTATTPLGIYVGLLSGSSGTYNLSETGQVSTGTLSLGYLGTGTGTFNQSGGTVTALVEGVGVLGNGTYNQSEGTNSILELEIGEIALSNGSYILSGGQLDCNMRLGQEFIGSEGTGTFTHSAGTNSAATMYLGAQSGSSGYYNLTGGIVNINDVNIGSSGSGTFDQSGGTCSMTVLIMASQTGSSGTYNLTGGTLTIRGENSLSPLRKGDGTAAFNFGGGTLQAGPGFASSLPMTLTGINGDAKIDTAGWAVTLSGQLSGQGGLKKLGGGTLTLTANNNYNGATTINAGTLALDAEASLASNLINVVGGAKFDVSALSGGFILTAGQTLKGSGRIVGDLTIDGIHAPGNSPGIQTVQGNYNMQGQLQIELAGAQPGTRYDQVLLSGPGNYNVNLGGTLLLDWTGFSDSSDSTQLWILKNNTDGLLESEFGNYADGAWLGVHDGRAWYIWYGADAATGNLSGGNDVLISAVPEPSTLLLGLGGIGFFLIAWRRSAYFRG